MHCHNSTAPVTFAVSVLTYRLLRLTLSYTLLYYYTIYALSMPLVLLLHAVDSV
jgi:hypothetical protein